MGVILIIIYIYIIILYGWGWVTHFLCYRCYFVTCYANESLPLRLLNSLPLREGQGGSFRGSCILPHLSRTCSDKMGWRDDMFKNIILMAHEWALIGESGKNKPPTNGDE